ncbi:MAG: hypothetical protein HYX61_10740 [Gammaproteobacteria bacterium]|jgi:serine/threonine protein kinase|nr:hypothetical protein [Gammaproteobacteria bacterium]
MLSRAPSSPTKAQLQSKAMTLPPIERKPRETVGQGDQSLILANGHNKVLVVTRYMVAKKIELLRTKVALDQRSKGLAIPEFVGMNENLANLIDPDNPQKAKKSFKYSSNILPTEIWSTNIVYELPRYEGSLEDCKGVLRYKEDSIEQLETYLYNVIDLLHEHNLTHNDISLKNIFYSGTYPHLEFHLGDFGSLTENSPAKHQKKCEADDSKIVYVINQLKQILENKRNIVNNKNSYIQETLPYFAARQAKKFGISPIKGPKINNTPRSESTSENIEEKSSSKKKLRF